MRQLFQMTTALNNFLVKLSFYYSSSDLTFKYTEVNQISTPFIQTNNLISACYVVKFIREILELTGYVSFDSNINIWDNTFDATIQHLTYNKV